MQPFPEPVRAAWEVCAWMSNVRNLNEGVLKNTGVSVDPGRGLVVGGLSSGGSVAAVIGSIPSAMSAGIGDFVGLTPLRSPITGIFSGLPFLVTEAMLPSEYRGIFQSRDMATAAVDKMRHDLEARIDVHSPWFSPINLEVSNARTFQGHPPKIFVYGGELDQFRDDAIIYGKWLSKLSNVQARVTVLGGEGHTAWVSPPWPASHSRMIKTVTLDGMAWLLDLEWDNSDEFGICLAAARQLATALDGINAEDSAYQFGIGLRVYEIRKNSAFDLLNHRNECFVREGPDQRVYIRGETETLEDGRVRVRPIATRACWSFEQLQRELQQGLKHRNTATSTIHHQSSRTHAVIEMEIITNDLLNARDSVVERQSELVPVGKHATDVYIEEQLRAMIQTDDGKYIPNPNYVVNQQRIDAAETKKADFESRVREAEQHESEVFTATSRVHPCIGGRLVFVDLAGAEFLSGGAGPALKQSPQEKQQGRQINTDLLALKEVIRARSLAQPRIPYRSSPLTMVLRQHFEASSNAKSSIILTVSPGAEQYAATMNTLKYGDLVGLANGNNR